MSSEIDLNQALMNSGFCVRSDGVEYEFGAIIRNPVGTKGDALRMLETIKGQLFSVVAKVTADIQRLEAQLG
jgi:hypothetical protein